MSSAQVTPHAMAGVSTGEHPTAEIDHNRPPSPWMPGGWLAAVGLGVLVASAGSGVLGDGRGGCRILAGVPGDDHDDDYHVWCP